MGKEKESLKFVYSQVADEVSTMYERYREKYGLEEENDLEKQLEILIDKKYISKTFFSDLLLISDYYDKEMYAKFVDSLRNYKFRILVLLELI